MKWGLLRDLVRSPIIQSFVIFASIFGLLFALFSPMAVNDVLDNFAIAGAILAVIRFGPYATTSLRDHTPEAPQILIAALTGMVVSIGALRLLRILGLSLGVLNSTVVAVAFAIITLLMVFSIFLLVISPPLGRGGLLLTPIHAVIAALTSGAVLTLTVLGFKAWW